MALPFTRHRFNLYDIGNQDPPDAAPQTDPPSQSSNPTLVSAQNPIGFSISVLPPDCRCSGMFMFMEDAIIRCPFALRVGSRLVTSLYVLSLFKRPGGAESMICSCLLNSFVVLIDALIASVMIPRPSCSSAAFQRS